MTRSAGFERSAVLTPLTITQPLKPQINRLIMEVLKHPEYSHLILVQIRTDKIGNVLVQPVESMEGNKYSKWVWHQLGDSSIYLQNSQNWQPLINDAMPFFAGETKQDIQQLSRAGKLAYIPDYYSELFTRAENQQS